MIKCERSEEKGEKEGEGGKKEKEERKKRESDENIYIAAHRLASLVAGGSLLELNTFRSGGCRYRSPGLPRGRREQREEGEGEKKKGLLILARAVGAVRSMDFGRESRSPNEGFRVQTQMRESGRGEKGEREVFTLKYLFPLDILLVCFPMR